MNIHGRDYLLVNQNCILRFNALRFIIVICYCSFKAIAVDYIFVVIILRLPLPALQAFSYLAILNIPQMCLEYENNNVDTPTNANDPVARTAFKCRTTK